MKRLERAIVSELGKATTTRTHVPVYVVYERVSERMDVSQSDFLVSLMRLWQAGKADFR